jgi:hypothetical protein
MKKILACTMIMGFMFAGNAFAEHSGTLPKGAMCWCGGPGNHGPREAPPGVSPSNPVVKKTQTLKKRNITIKKK